MIKKALLFEYEWFDLICSIPNENQQLKVIKAVFQHDRKTPEDLTPEEYLKELAEFDGQDTAQAIFKFLIHKVDISYNRFINKYYRG